MALATFWAAVWLYWLSRSICSNAPPFVTTHSSIHRWTMGRICGNSQGFGSLLRIEQVVLDDSLRQSERDLLVPVLLQLVEGRLLRLANDRIELCSRGHLIDPERHGGVGAELSRQVLGWHVPAIADDTREADLQLAALGQGVDPMDLLLDHGLGCADRRDEAERHPEDLGVFRIEHPLFVRLVADSAKPAANDLLAEKLGAERAHAQDVRDGVRVPSLRSASTR